MGFQPGGPLGCWLKQRGFAGSPREKYGGFDAEEVAKRAALRRRDIPRAATIQGFMGALSLLVFFISF